MGDAVPSEVAGRGRGADAVAPVKPRLRGVPHEVGAFVFPALGLLLVLLAPASSRVPVAIYTAGVTAMYATSACYHRGRWSISAKQRMRRLDHSMILIGIAATYTRRRLNPAGDRQANHALWRIVLSCMSFEPRTRAYVERRTEEGLTKLEIIRCLKRYVAREVYPHLLPAD